MAQIINTNIASLNAQRNLNNSQSANSQALERLSSGLRINSAADDAAGLAISTKFESQTRGLNQAIRNAGDGISLAQTAEGALGSMTDNLQRVRELAVQSSNATNSDEDRAALQQEVSALVAEVTRTAEETNFNGRTLFDGNFNGTFQIGANAGQTVDIRISELTSERLGSSAQAGVSAQGVDSKLENGDLTINGINIQASIASDDQLSSADREKSGISKVAAINAVADQTGVNATVDENVLVGSNMSQAADASAGVDITLNGVAISIQGTDNSDEASKAGTRGSVIAAINAKADQTGVIASDGGQNGGVVLTAEDGRNIVLESTAVDLAAFGLADSDITAADTETSYAGFTLTAENGSTDIVISGGNGTGNGDITNSGLAAGTYTSQTAFVSNTSATIAEGTSITVANVFEATLTAASVTAELGIDFGSGAAVAVGTAGFNTALQEAGYDFQLDTGITLDAASATAGLNAALAAKQADERGLQDGDLVLNDVAVGASSALSDTASDTTAASSDASASGISVAAAINKISEQTGVTATVNATEVTGGEQAADLFDGSGAAGTVTAGTTIELVINNVAVTLTETEDYEKNKANAITAINEVSGQTGVFASDNGESLTLTAADGRNISLYAQGNADYDGGGVDDLGITDAGVATNISNFGLSTDSVGVNDQPLNEVLADANTTYEISAKTAYSTVSLQSAAAFDVTYGSSGTKGLDDLGLTAGIFGGGADGQALTDVDVSTFEGAQEAITAIDNALSQVASQRADLGAVQNRFESTVSNLAITAENLTAANSRIRDADFAAETAELSRTQVLQQAGISILAQANQRPQQVLSLLG